VGILCTLGGRRRAPLEANQLGPYRKPPHEGSTYRDVRRTEGVGCSPPPLYFRPLTDCLSFAPHHERNSLAILSTTTDWMAQVTNPVGLGTRIQGIAQSPASGGDSCSRLPYPGGDPLTRGTKHGCSKNGLQPETLRATRASEWLAPAKRLAAVLFA
jgi:hypothetical protein